MGVRDEFPYDDHKYGFAIDLDRTTYFGEASSSTSQDPNENDNIGKTKLDDLPINQESSPLLIEKIK